jgi:hypothetical protein
MKFVAFCCILFLRDVRTRYPDEISCFFGLITSFTCEISCIFVVMRFMMKFHVFWLPKWCDVMTVERCIMKAEGDLVYTMVYRTLRGFMCKFGDSLARRNVSWVVVGTSASALGNRRVCVIRVTSMYYMKSIRMFEDDVTSPEHALLIQGDSLGGLG